jgi:hypothetical protein
MRSISCVLLLRLHLVHIVRPKQLDQLGKLASHRGIMDVGERGDNAAPSRRLPLRGGGTNALHVSSIYGIPVARDRSGLSAFAKRLRSHAADPRWCEPSP